MHKLKFLAHRVGALAVRAPVSGQLRPSYAYDLPFDHRTDWLDGRQTGHGERVRLRDRQGARRSAPVSGQLRPHAHRPLAGEPVIHLLLPTFAAFPYHIYPNLVWRNRAYASQWLLHPDISV